MRILLILTIVSALLSCTRNHNPMVIISTQAGDIEAELFVDKAPITAGNFLKYVNSGKYNNGHVSFYRVVRPDNQLNNAVKIEIIQGGFKEDSIIEQNQFPPIRHESTKESGILHKDGVISFARLVPGTASSEFFICIGDQPELDFDGNRNPDKQGFAAFGKVTKGMDVVRQIQKLKDKDQYLENPVKIIGITIKK